MAPSRSVAWAPSKTLLLAKARLEGKDSRVIAMLMGKSTTLLAQWRSLKRVFRDLLNNLSGVLANYHKKSVKISIHIFGVCLSKLLLQRLCQYCSVFWLILRTALQIYMSCVAVESGGVLNAALPLYRVCKLGSRTEFHACFELALKPESLRIESNVNDKVYQRLIYYSITDDLASVSSSCGCRQVGVLSKETGGGRKPRRYHPQVVVGKMGCVTGGRLSFQLYSS
eukprot:6322644-Amphidinium_carterae.1